LAFRKLRLFTGGVRSIIFKTRSKSSVFILTPLF
jgi:hypothetical protein